ncbi:MAG: hypothetical protein ACRDY5_10040 [Acidimicrobiales bacterium]
MGADGAVGWWRAVNFDGPRVFTRRHDPKGLALRVGPAGSPRAGEQTWSPDTNVVRTRLPAPAGLLEVVDLMPWAGPGLLPTWRIVRIVTVLAGTVEVVVEALGRSAEMVFSSGLGVGGAVVSTGFPVVSGRAITRLEAGQRIVVTVDAPGRTGEPLSVGGADDLLHRTEQGWRTHLGQLAYDGFHAAQVRRSLLTLGALTQASSGALLRDPMDITSRLVDVARASGVESEVGLFEEAARHAQWLALLLDDSEPPLAAAHSLGGDPVEDEDGIARAGLAAYAAVVDAVRPHQPGGETATAAMWDGLVRVADWLAGGWSTTSSVGDDLAAWHVLDRMTELAVADDPLSLDALSWRQAGAQLLGWLEEGVPEAAPEPGLLRAAWLGPWAGDAEPAGQLVQRVLDHWASDDGVHEPTAPAPLLAAVEALAALGRWEEAHERLEAVMAGPALGDLCAATHLSFVAAALALSAGPR